MKAAKLTKYLIIQILLESFLMFYVIYSGVPKLYTGEVEFTLILIPFIGYSLFYKTLSYNDLSNSGKAIHSYKMKNIKIKKSEFLLRVAQLVVAIIMFWGLKVKGVEYSLNFILSFSAIIFLILYLENTIRLKKFKKEEGKIFIFESGVYILNKRYISWSEVSQIDHEIIDGKIDVIFKIGSRYRSKFEVEVDEETLKKINKIHTKYKEENE